MKRRGGFGFTVIELLTVMTILAILAAILFPSLSGARQAADRARTKARFAQWAGAIEAFRREYGGYPALDATGLVNAGANGGGEHLFHDMLAGRARDGSALAETSVAARQNARRLAFHVFSDAEITTGGLICDAAGNTSIAVLVDRDLDGTIRIGGAAADYPSLPGVLLPDGSWAAPLIGTAPGQFPSQGLRAGVAFYSPAPGASQARREFVVSW